MIYIRIEMWPHGERALARLLGEAVIANSGGTKEVGVYTAFLSKFKGFSDPSIPKKSETWKFVSIKGFKRLRGGPWDLLLLVLAAAIGKRANKVVSDEITAPSSTG